jgi:hypothetical protein
MGRFFPEFSFTRSPGSEGIKKQKRDLPLLLILLMELGRKGISIMEYKQYNILHLLSGYTAIALQITMGIYGNAS